MKIVNIGTQYDAYGENLKVYDALPAQTYIVVYGERTGFHLEKYTDITAGEPKIYGAHLSKVNKVMNTYQKTERNLGVILSGAKGIGKTLFAKLLSNKAIEEGLPVIIVDRYIPGIASYLESIDQRVMVLFDEFEKTFARVNQTEPMVETLPLFDGIGGGNKLFVVTCNDIYNMNDYLINRPGRFHYHFRFDYPSKEEIIEYLQDKLEKDYWNQINEVVTFSNKVDLNYDCLRAIAFEINAGEDFKSAIQDLNILNLRSESYEATVVFENGEVFTDRSQFDLFSEADSSVEASNKFGEIDIDFCPMKGVYNPDMGCVVYKPEDLTITERISYDSDEKETAWHEKMDKAKIKHMTLKKIGCRKYHYTV